MAFVQDFIDDMHERGSDQVIIFAGKSAAVQDIAKVLNRLTVAGIGSVELISTEDR